MRTILAYNVTQRDHKRGNHMSFKIKIILGITVLMFLSLSLFSLISYLDTKKNSVIQIESSLSMASRSLTDFIGSWASGKKKHYGEYGALFDGHRDHGYLTNPHDLTRDDEDFGGIRYDGRA